jgi:hypothetical protein
MSEKPAEGAKEQKGVKDAGEDKKTEDTKPKSKEEAEKAVDKVKEGTKKVTIDSRDQQPAEKEKPNEGSKKGKPHTIPGKRKTRVNPASFQSLSPKERLQNSSLTTPSLRGQGKENLQ